MSHQPAGGAAFQCKVLHLVHMLRAVALWKQHFHVLPNHLARAVAERPLRGLVEEEDAPDFVSADHRIGDEPEDVGTNQRGLLRQRCRRWRGAVHYRTPWRYREQVSLFQRQGFQVRELAGSFSLPIRLFRCWIFCQAPKSIAKLPSTASRESYHKSLVIHRLIGVMTTHELDIRSAPGKQYFGEMLYWKLVYSAEHSMMVTFNVGLCVCMLPTTFGQDAPSKHS